MMNKLLFAFAYLFLTFFPQLSHAQISQPGVRQDGAVTADNLVVWDGNQVIKDGGSILDIFSGIPGCTTQGVIYYTNASGQIACLPPGNNGDLLAIVAGIPDWQVAGGGTGTVTSVGFVAGQGLSFSGTNPVTTNNTGTEATFAAALGAGLAFDVSDNIEIPTNGVVAGMITDANVTTSKIADANVTYAKIQNVADERILGNDSGVVGAPAEISVGGNLEFTGAGAIQRGAITGDVAASAGSGVTVVGAVNGVSYPASPSDDQIPVADSATGATYRSIPDCADVDGNHLNYTAATNTFSCGTSSSGGGGFVGEIIWYGGATCPIDTLTANGATPSQATYPNLYTAYGTTWGSDAGGNFTLPDLISSNRFIRSGASGTLQTDAFQGHYHTYRYRSEFQSAFSAGGSFDNIANTVNATGAGRITAPITDGSNGTPRTATETRPINAQMQPCIIY